jgi:hypothetical protein
MVTRTEGAQCAGRQCSRQVPRRQTGRPGRYCGALCRQAAYRERVRLAEQAERRARELAAAQANASRLWPQLEMASLDVSETAAAVVSYAAVEDEADRGALAWKLRQLREEVARLEQAALGYRQAAELAESLTAGTAAR